MSFVMGLGESKGPSISGSGVKRMDRLSVGSVVSVMRGRKDGGRGIGSSGDGCSSGVVDGRSNDGDDGILL